MECEPEFPSLRQPGIVSPSFMMIPEDFMMSRDEITGVDSGWVFCEPSYSGNEGEFKALYEITFAHMEVIPFLALPPGAIVTKIGNVIEMNCGDKQVSSRTSDLLHRLAKASILD